MVIKCLQWGDNILKKAAWARVLNQCEEKKLVDLAPSRVLLIRKEKSRKTVNIDEIIFYLKSMYSTHNEEPKTFIDDIPTEEPSFEAITNYQGWWKYELKKQVFIWWVDFNGVKSIQKREFII